MVSSSKMARQGFHVKRNNRRNDSQEFNQHIYKKMSELEFKTIIVRILGGTERSTEDTRESFTAEIKELKSSQSKIKNAITDIQSQMDAMKAQMDEAGHRISTKEDRIKRNNEARNTRGKQWQNIEIQDLDNSVTY